MADGQCSLIRCVKRRGKEKAPRQAPSSHVWSHARRGESLRCLRHSEPGYRAASTARMSVSAERAPNSRAGSAPWPEDRSPKFSAAGWPLPFPNARKAPNVASSWPENVLHTRAFLATPACAKRCSGQLDATFGAFLAFGKGSGHPAALNFGDLFSGQGAEPALLFKGARFAETDIRAVEAAL